MIIIFISTALGRPSAIVSSWLTRNLIECCLISKNSSCPCSLWSPRALWVFPSRNPSHRIVSKRLPRYDWDQKCLFRWCSFWLEMQQSIRAVCSGGSSYWPQHAHYLFCVWRHDCMLWSFPGLAIFVTFYRQLRYTMTLKWACRFQQPVIHKTRRRNGSDWVLWGHTFNWLPWLSAVCPSRLSSHHSWCYWASVRVRFTCEPESYPSIVRARRKWDKEINHVVTKHKASLSTSNYVISYHDGRLDGWRSTRASPLTSHLPSALDGDITHLKQGMPVVMIPVINFRGCASINFCRNAERLIPTANPVRATWDTRV